MVPREMGERICHREQHSKVSVRLRIPPQENDNIQKSKSDTGGQRSENDMDLRHDMPQEGNIEAKVIEKWTMYQ